MEDTRQDFAKEVAESVDNTSEDLSKITTDQESQWNSIQRRFQTHEKEFSDVGSKSGQYFNQLDELSAGITDEKIKSSEFRKNKELTSSHYPTQAKIEKSGSFFHLFMYLIRC